MFVIVGTAVGLPLLLVALLLGLLAVGLPLLILGGSVLAVVLAPIWALRSVWRRRRKRRTISRC